MSFEDQKVSLTIYRPHAERQVLQVGLAYDGTPYAGYTTLEFSVGFQELQDEVEALLRDIGILHPELYSRDKGQSITLTITEHAKNKVLTCLRSTGLIVQADYGKNNLHYNHKYGENLPN